VGEQGVSNLELRYRRLLRVLPGWYRQDREDEMVGLFLADRTDELDLEHSWPGWGETFAMLGLAVRTHLAAGAGLVPAKVVWRGEIVRALGMLGLLLGLFYAGVSFTNAVQLYNDPVFTSLVTWTRVLDLAPVVAFVALLGGKRTVAKVAAAVAITPGLFASGPPERLLIWVMFQVPSIVTLVCLCLGFHREAPTPPARRLAWWGGGAVLLGVGAGVLGAGALLVPVLAVVIMRVFAYVRGDVVLGRALSLFAALLSGPVAVLAVAGGEAGELVVPAMVAAALLAVSAAAPVRRARARSFRLP
jgi:hypothetical protein